VLQVSASLATQVGVGLVPVQMPVAQGLELEQSVSQLATLKQGLKSIRLLDKMTTREI
jgi:hypothetical protein